MEWIAIGIVLLILCGPIIWVFTIGRRSGVRDHEDPDGATAYGEFIRNNEAPPGGR
jgi:hypothetical protein